MSNIREKFVSDVFDILEVSLQVINTCERNTYVLVCQYDGGVVALVVSSFHPKPSASDLIAEVSRVLEALPSEDYDSWAEYAEAVQEGVMSPEQYHRGQVYYKTLRVFMSENNLRLFIGSGELK